MSQFSTYNDTPNQINTEGQEITVGFKLTSDSTGTVNWNIPKPAAGCSATEQAYNGVLIVLDTEHVNPSKYPINGQRYVADLTGSQTAHLGSKLGTGLVVGAFYDDKTTTSLTIPDLVPGQDYYVSAYAVDNVTRYFNAGVHSYALSFAGSYGTEDIAASHLVQLEPAVTLTSPTNLIPTEVYSVDIAIDGEEYSIPVPTTTATIGDLINLLEYQFDLLESPFINTVPPSTNMYNYPGTGEQLFIWDGYTNTEVDALFESSPPNTLNPGDYWADDLDNLSVWNGATWNAQQYIEYKTDPSSISDGTHWFDGTDVFVRDDNVWCSSTVYNQSADPVDPIVFGPGHYWYDINSSSVFKYNQTTFSWDYVPVLYWDVSPLNITVNTLWINDQTFALTQYNGSTWDIVPNYSNSTTTPDSPIDGWYWYNTDTLDLKQYNATTTSWDSVDFILFESTPTDIGSCDLWWSSVTDILSIYDNVTNTYVQVTSFVQQDTDPTILATITDGDIWMDGLLFKKYGAGAWSEIDVIKSPTEPIVVDGDVWFTGSVFYLRVLGAWVEIDPINSPTDPSGLVPGILWYNTSTASLSMWNGTAWTVMPVLQGSPVPQTGTQWYNTLTSELMSWNGTEWSDQPAIASVRLTDEGYLYFEGRSTGGDSRLIVSQTPLISGLSTTVTLKDPNNGDDGIDSLPSYQVQGVGTDGSTDERRELVDSIRKQFGYPTVEVELTKDQLNIAVDKALESLRKRSSAAYRRGYFFLDLRPGQSMYKLTNKSIKFNSIVDILEVFRANAIPSMNLYHNSVFGANSINYLYNSGAYDLLSYHMVSAYIEELEKIFASKIQFHWNEYTRELHILQSVGSDERILIDCAVEKTEQELLNDRWTKGWIEKYALAQSRMILARVRGKYGSLPGAGGGVALDAAEMQSIAEAEMTNLYEQLDDYLANDLNEWGIGSQVVMG